MRFCPDCGRERTEGSFCGDCGYRFPEIAQASCSKCGANRQEGFFCGDCGHRFTETSDPGRLEIGTLSVGVSRKTHEGKNELKLHDDGLKQISASLKYGKGFSQLAHCSNCGEPKADSKKSCNLCGSSFEK
jgi:uncharacterized membrane protein YvbJ